MLGAKLDKPANRFGRRQLGIYTMSRRCSSRRELPRMQPSVPKDMDFIIIPRRVNAVSVLKTTVEKREAL